MDEKLYLKFGKSETYFEIEVESFEPITAEPINDDNPVLRKKWGEIIIKNKPYEYRSNSITSNNLFTEIMGLAPTTYIFIKHIGNNSDVTEGYFGTIDCEVDSTQKKNIKVTPEIYDQYTPFLEFWDTKVAPYELRNVILNPEFDIWESGLPYNWQYKTGSEYLDPERMFFLENNNVKLKARGDYTWSETYVEGSKEIYGPGGGNDKVYLIKNKKQTFIYQTNRKIKSGAQVKISFDYALMRLWNPMGVKSYLSYKMYFTQSSGDKIYARTDGTWGYPPFPGVEPTITIDNTALPYDVELIDAYREGYFKIFNPPPEDAEITIEFWHNVPFAANQDGYIISTNDLLNDEFFYDNGDIHYIYYESDFILSNIIVASSTLTYNKINVFLSAENMNIKSAGQITDEEGKYLGNIYTARIPKDEVETYEKNSGLNYLHFFFDSETNEPNVDLFNDFSGHGESGHSIKVDKLIVDYIENTDVEPNGFFRGELYKIELFKRPGFDKYGLTDKRSTIRGRFYFAREEILSDELWSEEEYENGLCSEEEYANGKGHKIPERDVGWEQTFVNEKGEMLWVRKPYKGTIVNWQLTDEGSGYRDGELYERKLIAENIYPTAENPITYPTSVDLKDIVTNIYKGTNSELSDKEVYSTFLWNDYPSDELTALLLDKNPMLEEEPNTNYYTNSDNELRRISCLHTYELKTEKKQNDSDALLQMSFRELLDDLQIIFPHLYFFIDINGNLHLEHLSYEDYTQGMSNIRDYEPNYEVYKYNKNEMFAISDYSMINSGYDDFYYSSKEFDKIVSNRRRYDMRESKATRMLTSDIRFCMENPDDLDNGLILLNYDETETGEKVISSETGKISGSVIVNAGISIANMLAKYGNYEGTWRVGKINGNNSEFKHTKWSKEGLEPIEIKGIDQGRYFYNNIGIGKPRTVTYDYRKGITTLELRYRDLEQVIIVEDDNILEL